MIITLEWILIWCEMRSWRLDITFCIFLPMILAITDLFGPSFPKVSWCPKYPEAGETLPLTGFYTSVMLQLMWNTESNTFYEFLYPTPMIWGFWAEFPGLALVPKIYEGINQLSDSLYIWVRFHLMWNVKFNFLDNFLCIGVHDLGCLGSVGPTCPNSSNILKQV